MKTIIVSALFLSLILSSCEKNYEITCFSDATASVINPNIGLRQLKDSVTVDSLFVRSFFYEVYDETSLFQHKIFQPHCYNITHDRKAEIFKMAIPLDSTDHFSYRDEELKLISAHYYNTRYVDDFFPYIIETGSVIGEKVDDRHWAVSIDVIAKPPSEVLEPEELKIQALFKIQ